MPTMPASVTVQGLRSWHKRIHSTRGKVALRKECAKGSLVLLDVLSKCVAKRLINIRHFVHWKKISSMVLFTVLAIILTVALISVPQLGINNSSSQQQQLVMRVTEVVGMFHCGGRINTSSKTL